MLKWMTNRYKSKMKKELLEFREVTEKIADDWVDFEDISEIPDSQKRELKEKIYDPLYTNICDYLNDEYFPYWVVMFRDDAEMTDVLINYLPLWKYKLETMMKFLN